MKNFLCAILCLFLCISQAQAQTAIWAASDRSATTTEMRFAVDTSAVSTPGLLRIEPANLNGIYFNSSGRVFASALLFDSAGSLFLSGAAQYCDENGANCFDPSEVGGALQNLVEDLSPQLGAQLDVNAFGLGDGTLELLTFTEDGSAINHINIENEAIGSGPILSAAGDDTNVDLNLNGQLTGNVLVRDGTDVTKQLSFELSGATTGTTTTLAVSQTGNVTVTLPDATDTLVGKDTTDTLTTKSMAAGSNTFTGFVWDTNIFADGTDGQIPTFDASGEPAFIATGTNDQILLSNGAGAAPTFQSIGTDGQIIFNSSGSLISESDFKYDEDSNTLTMTGPVIDTADMPAARTADHTFALTDLGAYIRYDSTGSLSATVPPNSSVAFPIGQMLFGQIFDGDNTLTLVAGSGVTLDTGTSLVYTSAGFGLIKTATDVWTAIGGD